MNGAESLVRTLAAHDVDVFFSNPGTSEMHLVQAIDAVAECRPVLCLFEGVCTGAADGYARLRGTPAATLLHLGAGLGNGLANLHNCRRAGTPVVNVVGDHAIHHGPYDAPLTSDIEGVAQPVSAWIRTSRTAEGLALDGIDAVRAALVPRPNPLGGIATLIVPADCAWGNGRAQPRQPFADALARPKAPADLLERVAKRLDAETMLMIDGNGLTEAGVRAAGRLAGATGCRLFTPTFPARVEAGPELPAVARLPYFPEQVRDAFTGVRRLVLAGAEPPVAFFAYRNQASDLVPPDCEVIRVAHRHEDVEAALVAMADTLDAPPARASAAGRPALPTGPLSDLGAAQVLAARAPEQSIFATDSGAGAAAAGPLLQQSVRHTWLNLTGGSIGDGGPLAVGAAIASPGRQVFALQGDGGAMYTNQYLWTAAREGLPIISVIFNNRQYGILDVEYRRLGVNDVGAKAASLFDLGNPAIDWVRLAESQGVPGARATTCEEFDTALGQALAAAGPYLIEAVV